MTAHIIVDRQQTTLATEIIEQGIDYRIWEAVHDPNDVVGSIGRSHKKIISYAKQEGLPHIWICEEDVMFLGPDAANYYLDNMPAEFDLYLGGCYGLRQLTYERIARDTGPVDINNFAGLHCYIISERYYDRFLALPEDRHIDDQPGLGSFFVCAPFVALQHPGYSANNKTKVDYNTLIPKDCLYGQG